MSADVKEWLAACRKCKCAKAGLGRGRLQLEQDIEFSTKARLAMDLAWQF